MNRLRHRQAGFSLIEMMIALLLGAFLVLGGSQIYLDNKRSFLYQQSQTGNRNNALLTEQLLNRQLARTGFRANPQVQGSLTAAFPVLAAAPASEGVGCPAFNAGAVLAPTADSAANPSGLCLRYQGALDGKDLDCLGALIPALDDKTGGNILTELRYVVSAAAGSGSLTCTVWSERNGTPTFKGTSVLVQGLLDFRWAPPSGTGDTPAVRYAALLATSDAAQGGITSNVAANWRNLTGRQVNDNVHAMQIMQSSVTLRNLAP